MKKLLLTAIPALLILTTISAHAFRAISYNNPVTVPSHVTIVKDPSMPTNNDSQPVVTPPDSSSVDPGTAPATPVDAPTTPTDNSDQQPAPVVAVDPLAGQPTVDNPQILYDQNGNTAGTFHVSN